MAFNGGPAAPVKATVKVSERGELAYGTPRLGYRQGFAQLLDITSPPARIAILGQDAPTVIGFSRTAHALRGAMATFRRAKP